MMRFNVHDVLTFVPGDKRRKGKLETDQEMPMLEGALTLLCQLLSIRTQLGIYEATVIVLKNGLVRLVSLQQNC